MPLWTESPVIAAIVDVIVKRQKSSSSVKNESRLRRRELESYLIDSLDSNTCN